MRTFSWAIVAMAVLTVASTVTSAPRDLTSDTWVATDALGRQLPDYDDCGPARQNRTVGIFYFLWLGQHGTKGPFDITELLKADPRQPAWGPPGAFHHWGQSELGYYLSDSEYAIRKHASMLADAGVDTLIFDVTNAFTYRDVYLKLCEIYHRLRAEGRQTPQICFLTHSSARKTIETLYHDLYAKKLYPELWFYWKGKPLILGGSPGDLPDEIAAFFSHRDCWAWTYGKDTWQWLDHPERRYGWHESPDKPEEMAVSVAQHPTTNIGRSCHNGTQPEPNDLGLTGSEHLGLYFDEQWQRALKVDPEFVFVTGWNEWVAQRFLCAEGSGQKLLGRTLEPGESFFVDAYNQEYSRDIEPMKGGFGDNYYLQLVANVRRYKGVQPPAQPSEPVSIEIDGHFDSWARVRPEFRDHRGDTMHRNHRGYGKTFYADESGRNDFVAAKVARDAKNLYFYVETANPITNPPGPGWMTLLIDIDRNKHTGREGYDYAINRKEPEGNEVTLEQSWRGRDWFAVGHTPFRVQGDRMELAIPRTLLGLPSDGSLDFEFKWTDNMPGSGDIMDFYRHGDVAPSGRFNYRYHTP